MELVSSSSCCDIKYFNVVFIHSESDVNSTFSTVKGRLQQQQDLKLFGFMVLCLHNGEEGLGVVND